MTRSLDRISNQSIAIVLAVTVLLSVAAAGGAATQLDSATHNPTQVGSTSHSVNTSEVTIQMKPGGTRGSDSSITQQLAITSDSNLTFDNGNNYQLRVTNEDTDASATLAVDGSLTVQADGFELFFWLYHGNGSADSTPRVSTFDAGFVPVTVTEGLIPASEKGLTNFSVTLLDATTGEELAQTDPKPAILGYNSTVQQNISSEQAQVSIPRDVVPKSTNVTLTVWPASEGKSPSENAIDLSASYNPTTDSFEAVVDASTFNASELAWGASFSSDGYRTLRLISRIRPSGNITFGATDGPRSSMSRSLPSRVTPGGDATVTVTADVSSPPSFSESFDPSVANVTINRITVNGNTASPFLTQADKSGMVVTFSSLSSATPATVKVKYTVSVPESATVGSTYNISGTVSTDSGERSLGTDQLTVRNTTFSGVTAQYNPDGNRVIDISELGTAAADYVQGKISITDLGTIAAAYVQS